MELVWMPRAEQARNDSIEYVLADNPMAAWDQMDEIDRQLHILMQHPHAGRRGRVSGTREFVITRTPYIAVYVVMLRVRRINIVAFLHGSQAWP
ncbi:MAG TPA: type II toxin-antitoxin system RelE/ParE family toxin [Pinirhizobacter sp.]|uniref:type II toxin-antitoxin system RelE/ParE family toxin n=1 Tax=Pinirhizobacter sp. TaxID=2950432 RepID=UPI002C28C46B|nr:type II toxin-antitoxin system RelE/ParE family toxin [Pinirhizobacter sp.]HMH69375.1 type II toxin-antitoxin system RelE/ParE family toxin [Pinirhizobacter sp.]